MVMQSPNFAIAAPFVSRYVRTLSGGRIITIGTDGRAIVYSDSATDAGIITDLMHAATAAYEYQNALTAQKTQGGYDSRYHFCLVVVNQDYTI